MKHEIGNVKETRERRRFQGDLRPVPRRSCRVSDFMFRLLLKERIR